METFYDKVRLLLEEELKLNPKDLNDYLFNLRTLKEEFNTYDNIECTLKITTRKKGLVTSVYDKRDDKWLGKIIEFPKEPRFNLSRLHYGQLLYCNIYFENYQVDSLYNKISWIELSTSTPRKFSCKCFKSDFIPVTDEYNGTRLGLKPYKSVITYDTFTDKYSFTNQDHYCWTINNCPFCGTKLYKNHKKMNWDLKKKKHIQPPEKVELFLKEIEEVCKKYNLYLDKNSYRDPFTVEKLTDNNFFDLRNSHLDL
jgi:hypothetical protein